MGSEQIPIEEVRPYRNRIDEYLREQYPILDALDMDVATYDYPRTLLRIVPKPRAREYVLGTKFESMFTDEYEEREDNIIRWDVREAEPSEPYQGFVTCIANLENQQGAPILHLVGHITLLDTSFAFHLDDVAEAYLYPHNAAEVMAMYQNAEEDGSTVIYNRLQGWGNAKPLSVAELEPLVTTFWPEPELIYTASS